MIGAVINLEKRQDRLKQFWNDNAMHIPFQVNTFNAIESSIGEDGCTQSHLAVLKGIKTFPFIVFEDDCIMLQPWRYIVQAGKQLPKNWDALWLGANPRKRLQQYSLNLFRLKNAYCLHAVIYNSKRMIDYILENHNTPSGKNLDIFIANDVQEKFNCYSISPIAATQRSDWSDIAKVQTKNYDEIIKFYEYATR
jgi:GR25 family glycosyltransferase involved in LPS biosynthesis